MFTDVDALLFPAPLNPALCNVRSNRSDALLAACPWFETNARFVACVECILCCAPAFQLFVFLVPEYSFRCDRHRSEPCKSTSVSSSLTRDRRIIKTLSVRGSLLRKFNLCSLRTNRFDEEATSRVLAGDNLSPIHWILHFTSYRPL